jgi:hypothetical protein
VFERRRKMLLTVGCCCYYSEPSIIQRQDRLDSIDFPQDLTRPCAFVSKVPMHQSAHHFLFVTVLTLRDEITILSISVLFLYTSWTRTFLVFGVINYYN